MVKSLAKLCELLEECDIGCVVLTARYRDFCHPEMDSAPGVFISPLSGDVNSNKKDCSAKIEQQFLIAPFVKCETDELNQVLKMNGELKGPLIEAWEAFYKLKECIFCDNEKRICDKFYLNRILNPDVCGAHVVLPTVWTTEFIC